MPETGNKKEDDNFSRLVFVLFVVLALSTFTLMMLAYVQPSFSLSLVMVFGVIDMLIVLTLASTVLKRIDLFCKDEALGLPAGSIRAIIALSLIVIFAIMAVFMYSDLAPQSRELVSNVTTTFPNGTVFSVTNSTWILAEPTQSQRDFSLQTLTTVSTLVVALAGFYFGTKSVETAHGGEKKETE